MHSTDPAVFNRVCGPLIAATADPADHSFAIQVSVAVEMVSISATFSRQIRHIAAPRDTREPSVIILFPIDGAVSLRMGGVLRPLDLALISSDTDFDVRPEHAGDTCSVGCIALKAAPDLVALIPRPLVVSPPAGDGIPDSRLEALRRFGTQVIERIARSAPQGGDSAARDAAHLGELIRDRLAAGEWPRCAASDPPAAPGGRDIVAVVQRYLRDHAGDAELTPARLARHCAVSVRKLYNAFAGVDMSLRATVLSYRLEEARRQLHSRAVKKVTSIAFDTGFRDVSTFYRNFRREFGYSPRSNGDAPGAGAEEAGGRAVHHEGLPDGDGRDPIVAGNLAADWARPRQKSAPESADHEKPPLSIRDGADAIRLCSPYDAHVESVHLPRNTLFRNHPPRSRKLLRGIADKSRPR